MRLGVVRESMACAPGSQAEDPIAAAAAREIKAILGGRLGATLVEPSDPRWPPDGDLEVPRAERGIVFRAEPGREDTLVRIAAAYEAASRLRVPARLRPASGVVRAPGLSSSAG